ncbi:sodium:proton antiporter [Streptomyces montanisoli]|uniref:NADH-quinone oxidoreductase subunit K n=1 Tax=Streptomyces montanisoli TaxID=2798581 RepID=A0A940RW00_9ACTN|nr:NADH-quinone oxidoreductase subunit K [Streptomyces montanisoli]MBP0458766.1 NADH-quinone oxidoreductase subunit K [Streptomyces montanisoli]
MSVYPYVVAGVLFLAGLYGVVSSRNYIHAAVCLTVMQSGTYVALIALGAVSGGQAPITKGAQPGKPMADPVVQALTLTDVVVSVVALALMLALAQQSRRRGGTLDPDELARVRG